MPQFINTRETLVTEAIDGMLRTAGGRLARLDGYPHIKVVMRADWDRARVALISGGGSGHEPSHAGFVGQGMLTAAVCGEVFASPSVDAVLAAILAVTGKAGCLLIVKNYTGDRLNFGLALERARAQGLRVRMVIVDDDIALPHLPQPRGVAGTLFVHKIAGALAEQGADLDAVTEAARRVIGGVVSIGMSLDTCTIPGSTKEARIRPGKAELGLGIHGEAGIEQVDFSTARAAMAMVVDRLAPRMGPGPHVALLNNLGGATPLEMGVLAEELLTSKIGAQIRWLVGPAPMMTSLDMQGFSVSLLPVARAEEAALAAPVAPWAWPGCLPVAGVEVVALPDGLAPIRPIPSPDDTVRALIARCCAILIEAEGPLNALDAGDGGARAHRRAGPAAARRSDAALPRHRAGTEPDHGRLLGRASGDLLCGGRRCLGQRARHDRGAESGAGPHPAGGRRARGRPHHDRRARPRARCLGRWSRGGGRCGAAGCGCHRAHYPRAGRTRELSRCREPGRTQRSGGRGGGAALRAAEHGPIGLTPAYATLP